MSAAHLPLPLLSDSLAQKRPADHQRPEDVASWSEFPEMWVENGRPERLQSSQFFFALRLAPMPEPRGPRSPNQTSESVPTRSSRIPSAVPSSVRTVPCSQLRNCRATLVRNISWDVSAAIRFSLSPSFGKVYATAPPEITEAPPFLAGNLWKYIL